MLIEFVSYSYILEHEQSTRHNSILSMFIDYSLLLFIHSYSHPFRLSFTDHYNCVLGIAFEIIGLHSSAKWYFDFGNFPWVHRHFDRTVRRYRLLKCFFHLFSLHPSDRQATRWEQCVVFKNFIEHWAVDCVRLHVCARAIGCVRIVQVYILLLHVENLNMDDIICHLYLLPRGIGLKTC